MGEPSMVRLQLWEDEPTPTVSTEMAPQAVPSKTELHLAEEEDGVVVTGVENCGASLEIPSGIGGRRVVAIGASALQGKSGLRRVSLPEGLRRIGRSAFQGCSGLVGLRLPDGLGQIGAQAFQGCAALERIDLPAGLSEIPDRAFYGCAALRSIALPESISQIGERAFAGCKSLSDVRLPEGLTRIGPRAFADCPSLKDLSIPKRVTELSANALPKSLLGLDTCYLEAQGMLVHARVKRDYAVPRGTRVLAGQALAGNDALLRVDFGDVLERIGARALADCVCLKAVELPGTVKSVGAGAFSGCHRLASVRLSPGMDRIAAEAFLDCRSLEAIELPPGLEAVGPRAFEGCRLLKRLSIPDGVREIGERAFYRCAALEWLELPESLARIGAGALSGCAGLRTLVVNAACDPATLSVLADARQAAIVAPLQPPEAFPGPWRKRVCLGYARAMNQGIPFRPEAAEACTGWMRSHPTAFIAEALRDKSLMHLLADNDCLSGEAVQILLERADGPDRSEYFTTLLDYGNRRFSQTPSSSISLW